MLERSVGSDLPSEELFYIDIDHVARLARVALSQVETDRLRVDLAKILQYASKVGEVATDDVVPTASAIPRSNVLRPDTPEPGISQQAALANAPESAEGRFRVPRVQETGT
ncbi:MAG: Asp-tRNA(Asn)/Glu-tRNA(Gln) amidotransferase subunit GatC [Actinomycetota bacterium]